MQATERLTIGNVVTHCLARDWNMSWEEVQKHVLKDFPHSQFKNTHMPIYKRYIFEGRLSFDDNKIPDDVWNKHASKMLVARRHRTTGVPDAKLTNRKGGWPKTKVQPKKKSTPKAAASTK